MILPTDLSTPASNVLKTTISRCPVCLGDCPAQVIKRDNKVYLDRTCPLHGAFSACIASDFRFYWVALGKEENRCGAGSSCCSAAGEAAGTLGRNAEGHGEQPFEVLSTCLALIEIVNSCNLACPTCYADSPVGVGPKVDAVPLEELKARIQGVIDRKGGIEILQLSGGEPTLHPQLFDLCRWCKQHPKIDFVLLNTNGVLLAKDPAFAHQLSDAFEGTGLQLYLQFDGVQQPGQRELRGADLREMRERAIEHCAAADIPVTLAMTVTPDNLGHLWEAVEFGLKRDSVHGITFQPVFSSGRGNRAKATPVPAANPFAKVTRVVEDRLNTADVLLGVVGQSGGQLRFEDFTPLPCGDPNCATIGYLIRRGGQGVARLRLPGLHPAPGLPPGQDPLHARRPGKVRLRQPAPRRPAQDPGGHPQHGLPPHGQALHGRLDVGPGPHRPLLHPRHPP
jgi:hypothetical protein